MITIVIPALNEEKTVGICVKKAIETMRNLNVEGEVIVADNGSTDKTEEVALRAGARVIKTKEKGYGAAYRHSIPHALGEFIIVGDADDSYNFEEIGPFIEKLNEGYELVMGNRFKGKIEKGAMPLLHHYIGTPILTGIMNLFFKVGIGDTNCGMRGFTKSAFEKMKLKTSGMEFATEMVIKSSAVGLKICEIPCNLYRDKRGHPPHLNTWKDGWRYLRFMLLFAPYWTYLVPGLTLMSIGILGMITLFVRDCTAPQLLGNIIKPKYFSLLLLPLLMGSQIVSFGVIAHSLSYTKHYNNINKKVSNLLEKFKLEKGLLASLLLLCTGGLVFIYLIASNYWGVGPIIGNAVRNDLSVIATALIVFGTQIFYTSFLLSINILKVI
ncbi:MAG: glycosyltransferase family 2 protein [Candidatus Aegiribacteria sp.]|nr:glycosyltransferase family 2 protein [Candidatus Aegiribacteria sp.]